MIIHEKKQIYVEAIFGKSKYCISLKLFTFVNIHCVAIYIGTHNIMYIIKIKKQ